MNKVLPFEHIATIFDTWGNSYSTAVAELGYTQRILDFIKKTIPNTGTILDIGCGPGNIGEGLKGNYRLIGFDSSKKCLQLAKKIGYTTLQTDLFKSWPNIENVDIIICTGVLGDYIRLGPSLQKMQKYGAEHIYLSVDLKEYSLKYTLKKLKQLKLCITDTQIVKFEESTICEEEHLLLVHITKYESNSTTNTSI